MTLTYTTPKSVKVCGNHVGNIMPRLYS